MIERQTRAVMMQKKVDPLRLLELKPVRQYEPGQVQVVARQVAYRRVQVNHNGLKPANLLTTQRQTGNHFIRDVVQCQGALAAAVLTDTERWDHDWTSYAGQHHYFADSLSREDDCDK